MATADDHRTYSIRQLCREFGATARALRFYEDKGLLNPARKGQTRVYDARDRARLKLILRGRRIGFSLQEIQETLELDTAPLRIECVDISHTQGTDVMASLVVFEDGLPRKSDYRLYRIREAAGDGHSDDVASIAMTGSASSLNAAVAGSIVLHEALRQRG